MSYGWKIIKDHLTGPGGEFYTGEDGDEAGTIGPRDITPEHERLLMEGWGRTFQMYDDDGVLYYTGLLYTDDYDDEEACYGPLGDFGAPNAGCTEIRYPDHPEMDCS